MNSDNEISYDSPNLSQQHSRRKRKFKIFYNNKIAEGAFGSIYEGVDSVSNDPIIVKVISRIDSYKREVNILKQLDGHPHIVRILGHKISGDSGYIFMEKINGTNLMKYVDEEGDGFGLTEIKSLSVFSKILAAVMYMHSLHISHHDLKTENIVYDDAKEIPKVVDFGLSIKFDESGKVNCNAGSPLFSAPEVLRGFIHDPRLSDIWSLGVILYYLLTGTYPYRSNVNTINELLEVILEENYIYFPCKVSKSTCNLVRKMLKVNPNSRIDLELVQQEVDSIINNLDDGSCDDDIFYSSPSTANSVNGN